VTPHALHSSERQDWQTPEDPILVRVRKVGPIVCDPATSPSNPTRARSFYAPLPTHGRTALGTPGTWIATCGLRGAWPTTGLTWINPPYGAHLDGAIEPDREIVRGGEVVGVGTGWAARIALHPGERLCLVPNRTEVAWFETLHGASYVRAELRRRIPFVDARTGLPGKQPNHGSVLFYDPGPRGLDGVRAFVSAFLDIARILPGGKTL